MLRPLSSDTADSRRPGKRILVACHEMVVTGGLYRFDRFGRTIRRFDHHLAFVTMADKPVQHRTTDLPILTFEEATERVWDATFVPGAGFPSATIEKLGELRTSPFGVRVQHVLNDPTLKSRFLDVNRRFAPHIVIFNNRHWRAGDFIEFAANAFYFLEGAVDLENLSPDPSRFVRRIGRPFVVGGLADRNSEPLIKALRLCGPDVKLRLLGYPGEIAERDKDLIERGSLHLEGPIHESALPAFYADVDCIAHTATFAGWANLAAEAMASGVPVICTPHGTTAFADKETALVIHNPTPEVLADAILQLKGAPSLGARLAQNARRRIRAFSWTAYSADLLHLIDRPTSNYYTWSPRLQLFGRWPEEELLHGLAMVLETARGASICEFGARDGVISRRLLDRGAAVIHGFEVEPSRVALANRVCLDFPGAQFRQADLSEWSAFEAEHGKEMQKAYDIVLYLGLHHHLRESTRIDVLKGAAEKARRLFAIRTRESLFHSDNIEAVLAGLGFVTQTFTTCVPQLGCCYVFTRQPDQASRD